MSKTLEDISLLDLVPDSIKKDPDVEAAAKALDPPLLDMTRALDLPSLYVSIDQMTSEQLDAMAYGWDASVWRDSWPLSLKRSVLKNVVTEKRKKGTVRAVLDALADGTDYDTLALAIHHAVARSMADAATRVARRERLTAVALSGGCFMNRLLLTETARRLSAAGLTVLAPRDIPVNDGCIAYGQAAVARALLAGQR